MNGLDEALLLAVNSVRSPSLDAAARWLTEWGLHVLLATFPLAALRTRSRLDAERARDGALVFFLALFVAETLVKPLAQRTRPSGVAALAQQLHLLGPRPSAQSYSLPSGTATGCVAAAAWIWLQWGPRAGAPAALFAAAVCWSRLYAGVHWPSDLLAGALLGTAVALAIRGLNRWISQGPDR